MSFLDDATGVGRSKTLAIATVVGTTIGMSGIRPAEAAPSTPVADECWSCGFDSTDSTYDASGFTDDPPERWPFFEPPPGFNGGARRLDWREARPSWRSRFGVRRW